jgi:hypothetical protein
LKSRKRGEFTRDGGGGNAGGEKILFIFIETGMVK